MLTTMPRKHLGSNFVYYGLKSRIFVEVDALLTRGRTSRDKSIIDVLIFGIGHVLHHPPTSQLIHETVTAEDYQSKRLTY
ncbi:MAG: hypothetical protein MZV70_64535 [Desulfobacterales bacterium]|nr:hypothetical protein [Desulfobacterales bacterium]